MAQLFLTPPPPLPLPPGPWAGGRPAPRRRAGWRRCRSGRRSPAWPPAPPAPTAAGCAVCGGPPPLRRRRRPQPAGRWLGGLLGDTERGCGEGDRATLSPGRGDGGGGDTPLTSVPGEVEAEDGGAVVAQVLQGLQVLLQFPVGQLRLQERRQAAEDEGVEGRRPGAQRPATGSPSLPPSPPKATGTPRPPSAPPPTPHPGGCQAAPPPREGSLLPAPEVRTERDHPVPEQLCCL